MIKTKRTSISFFLPSLEVGGTEKNVVNLVNNINRDKYAVSIVLGDLKGDFIDQVRKDIPIINLSASHSVGLFFVLVRYFNTQRPDIFVSAFPRINVICLAAKFFSRSNVKIIITEHSVFSMLPIIAKTFWRRMFARFCMPFLVKYFYPKADAILCVSQGIADDILAIIKTNRIVNVIYNPVIDDTIYQLAKEAVFDDCFSSTQDPIIIAVGRLVDCKDYPTLFRAFKLVLKNQSAKLVVLGNGPERARLTRLSYDMGLSDSVFFLGFQKNPFKYMSKSSVFVLSSLQEGFGNVLIEAMASGVPVVSTNCPTGPGEIISHNENGKLVPVGDENAISKAIQELLENPSMAAEFREAGKNRAEFFSVKKSVKEYERVFELLNFSA